MASLHYIRLADDIVLISDCVNGTNVELAFQQMSLKIVTSKAQVGTNVGYEIRISRDNETCEFTKPMGLRSSSETETGTFKDFVPSLNSRKFATVQDGSHFRPSSNLVRSPPQ